MGSRLNLSHLMALGGGISLRFAGASPTPPLSCKSDVPHGDLEYLSGRGFHVQSARMVHDECSTVVECSTKK